jgi:hypothetical protein
MIRLRIRPRLRAWEIAAYAGLAGAVAGFSGAVAMMMHMMGG